MKTVIVKNGIRNGKNGANQPAFNGEFEYRGRNLTYRNVEGDVVPGIHYVKIVNKGKNIGLLVNENDYTFSAKEREIIAPKTSIEVQPAPQQQTMENVVTIKREFIPEVHEIEVPQKSALFQKGANFKSVHSIVKSGMFMPIMITGPSGNGKTFMAQQACAHAKRKMIRVQISPETDEDSLIGGMRLIDGNTVFEKGPVINAMEQGAVLLLDEIDRGSNRIMCMQGIMEGADFVIKRTGETIKVTDGFTIIATANTKGTGSDDGSFAAATIIDDAFLERFVGVIDQGWPTVSQETKMLINHLDEFDMEKTDGLITLINRLTRWAKTIRTSYAQGGVSAVISTRRLVHILKMTHVLDDTELAVSMACAKFDEDTKEAMLSALELITGDEVEED